MNSVRDKIQMLAGAVLAVTFLIIVAVCMAQTQHNIGWPKELFVTIVILCCLGGLFYAMQRASRWLEEKEKICLTCILLAWGILLYGLSCLSRNEPMHDYASVYQAAYRSAYGGEVDWTYLARWKNNFPLFLFLSLGMRICAGVGVADPFYFLLLINVIAVEGAIYCVYRMTKNQTQNCGTAFFAVFLVMAFLPLWGETGFMYTDSVSLIFVIWPVYLLQSSHKPYLKYGLAGLLWGIGGAIKATAAISMIAVFLIWVITQKKSKYRKMAVIIIAFIVVEALFGAVRMQYPCYELEKQYGAPVEYWIALGLNGNGGYGENEQFALECLAQEGVQAKRIYAREYIRANVHNIVDRNHLVQKVRYNFASGNMGLSDYNRYPGNITYPFFNDYGSYGGYTAMLTSGYFYALLLLGVLGQAINLYRMWKKDRRSSEILSISQLTIFGLFLFLMLWEANNRQLYNHIPWYALSAAFSLQLLHEEIIGKKRCICTILGRRG